MTVGFVQQECSSPAMQTSALLVVFMDVGTEATEEEFHGTCVSIALTSQTLSLSGLYLAHFSL